MKASRTPLLPFAATTFLLLLNYPWLSLFSSEHLLFGMPPLFFYLFLLWLGFILIIRVLIQPGITEEEDDLPPPPSLTKDPDEHA